MVTTINRGLKIIKVMSAEIKNLKNLQNTEYSLKKLFDEAEDFLPLLGTDYVELYVGNAKQSAHYYKTAFGFQSEAYAGLETGMKDRVSYVLKPVSYTHLTLPTKA